MKEQDNVGYLVHIGDPNKELLIIFSSYYHNPGIPKFEFLKILNRDVKGVNYILLKDDFKCAYFKGVAGLSTDTESTVDALQKLILSIPHSKVRTLGLSLGAHAALRFGLLLNVYRVDAFSIQSFLTFDLHKKHNDRRLDDIVQFIEKSIVNENDRKFLTIDYVDTLNNDTILNLYYGSIDKLDKMHIDLIENKQRFNITEVDGAWHGDIIRKLKASGELIPLLSSCEKDINFFSTSDNERYNMFIIPHIISVLSHVENSFVEIAIKNEQSFKTNNKEALDILDTEFKGRYLIRQMSNEFDSIKYIHLGQIYRFLDIPQVKCDYTYIGDIDIITFDKNIVEIHEQLMSKQRLPYSNIVREGTERLTGCIFLKTKKYYDAVQPIIEKFKEDPSSVYHPILNDEILLYHLVKQGIGLPENNSMYYRPIHGIHISLNRPNPMGDIVRNVPGWGINGKRLQEYRTFRNMDIFKKLESYFTKEFREFITMLDNIKI